MTDNKQTRWVSPNELVEHAPDIREQVPVPGASGVRQGFFFGGIIYPNSNFPEQAWQAILPPKQDQPE